jgi:hypothetical protein
MLATAGLPACPAHGAPAEGETPRRPEPATSAPGSDWFLSRSRRETARSSAKSRGAAIATCELCLCRRHGLADQDKELGTLRAQILDRSRQEAVAPQRAGDRAR